MRNCAIEMRHTLNDLIPLPSRVSRHLISIALWTSACHLCRGLGSIRVRVGGETPAASQEATSQRHAGPGISLNGQTA
jgi:hypothetical protein